jgi:copper chaperone
MSEITLSVPDISCGHCKTSIEGAVGALGGVDRVEVSIESKTVAVQFDDGRTDLAAITTAIEEQGYDVAS